MGVQCLICGKTFDRLYTHIARAHKMDSKTYRKTFGEGCPLVSDKVRKSCKRGFFAALRRLDERGSLWLAGKIWGDNTYVDVLDRARRKAQAYTTTSNRHAITDNRHGSVKKAKKVVSKASNDTYNKNDELSATLARRRLMKTAPDVAPRADEVRYDLKKLKVEMVDGPTNPYKAMFMLATSTWGSREKWWKRWDDATPLGRMRVVEAILSGQTLPTALECPSFTFVIQGMTRASYDQLARERYSGIGSMGSRDDAHLDAALILPPRLKPYSRKIERWWKATKDLYEEIVSKGKESWQTARFVLPSGMEWRFTWTMNYRAFQQMVAKRMCFAEQHDTVAVAWMMWNEMWKKWPLLAAYARPACDRAGRCLYSQRYTLAEMFGNLFLPCGRHKVEHKPLALFNEVSCSREELLDILPEGVMIPEPGDWEKLVEEARRRDMKWFLK